MNIELYSVKGFTGSALKQKLEAALLAHHMPYTIVEIHQVDQFIKAGLAAVPAIKIGTKIIQHPHDGVPDETVQKVIAYILSEKINSILVPIDFSDESNHAIHYARMVASHFGLGLTLAHIYQTLYDPISAGAIDLQFLHDTNKRLLEMVDSLTIENESLGIEIPVMAHMEIGEASSSLIDLLDHGQFELLIMGTKGTDNAIRRFFGTVSSEVSRHSKKPVIVVPPQAELKFPGKVVVGFTEELMLEGTLEYILAFGVKNNVFFDFVHITNDTAKFTALKNKLYERLVVNREMLCGFNIRSLTDQAHQVHQILFEYANEVRADLVILVTHHRSFLEGLGHMSVTRKALQHPPLPLMIIHHP